MKKRRNLETTTVEVIECTTAAGEDAEYEVTIAWKFSDYDPGRSSGPVEACYPPEGGEVEECVVTLPDGTLEDHDWLEVHVNDIAAVEDHALNKALGATSY